MLRKYLHSLKMYSKENKLIEHKGNNAFSASERLGRQLFIPKMIKGGLEDLKIGNKIAFEEVFLGKVVSFLGLENFIETDYRGKKMYIFDNHNHAFYFWYLNNCKTDKCAGSTLIHIDEHSDLREPDLYYEDFLDEMNSKPSLINAYKYTNEVLNVGNYIKPAIKHGILSDTLIVTSENELENLESMIDRNYLRGKIILNLDIDFFSLGMSYIDFEKKKRIILKAADISEIITVSTSPYFIDQSEAIDICKNIFK